jgi:hypothetical protein
MLFKGKTKVSGSGPEIPSKSGTYELWHEILLMFLPTEHGLMQYHAGIEVMIAHEASHLSGCRRAFR